MNRLRHAHSRRSTPRRLALLLAGGLVMAMLAVALALALATAPAGAQTSVTLIGNSGQADGGAGGLHIDHAQAFTTGTNSGGYKLTGIDLKLADVVNAVPSFTISIHESSSNAPGTSLGTLSRTTAVVDNVLNGWSHATGIDLAASTTYFLVVNGSGSSESAIGSLRNTRSDSEDSGGAAGWSIADTSLFKQQTATSWSNFSQSKVIVIKGYAKTSTNNAPVFASTTVTRSIAENTAASQNVGSPVSATDSDSDTLSYTLGGTDAASFSIVSTTGQIQTATGVTYDFEAKQSYSVTVTATDATDSATANVTINLTDVSEPPSAPAAPTVTAVTSSSTSLSVSWTAPANSGKPSIIDYDVRYRQSGTTSWTNGPQDTQSPVTLSSLSAGTAYQVQVRATNAEGNSAWSASGTGTTNSGTNSTPVFIPATVTRSIAENTASGQDVGDAVSATDADGNTLTYTLGGTDAASFTIVSTSGQIQTKSGVTYNYEAKTSYTVTVTATDGSASATATVTINITDVSEPPSAPGAPTVSLVSGSTTSLSVSWTAPTNTGKPAITSYDVRYRNHVRLNFTNGPQNVSGTSTTITGLTANRGYQVQVRATNAEGDSAWSSGGYGYTGTPSNTDARLNPLLVTPKEMGMFTNDFWVFQGLVYSDGISRSNVGVAAAVDTVKITATPRNSGGSANITPTDSDSSASGHQVGLTAGRNTVTIVVTAADNTTTQTYRISVNRGVTTAYGWKASHDIQQPLVYNPLSAARGIWSNGTTMWIADNTSDKIDAYSVSDRHHIYHDSSEDFNALSSAGNGDPEGLWSDGTTMWVVDSGDDKIYAYKMSDKTRDSSKEFNTLSSAGNNNPTGLWSDGITMWVVDSGDDKIYAYKMSDKTRDSSREFNTLSSAGNNNTRGIWSDETTMFVMDSADWMVYSYNHPVRAVSMSASGTSMVITFNQELGAAASLANSAFTVKKTPSGGAATTVSLSGSPVISGKTVTLTLASAVVATDANVKVSYTKPTSGSNNKLVNRDGAEVATFENLIDLRKIEPEFASSTMTRSVPENTGEDQNVGAPVTASYALRYSLRNEGDFQSFKIDSSSGQIQTRYNRTYDHEAKAIYTVTVIASDGTNFATTTVTINITDVDEPPSRPAAPTVSAFSGDDPRLTVSWTAPSNTGKPDITGYDVRHRETGADSWIDGPQDQTVTSVTLRNIDVSKPHEVQVLARNDEGDSDWSDSGTDLDVGVVLGHPGTHWLHPDRVNHPTKIYLHPDSRGNVLEPAVCAGDYQFRFVLNPLHRNADEWQLSMRGTHGRGDSLPYYDFVAMEGYPGYIDMWGTVRVNADDNRDGSRGFVFSYRGRWGTYWSNWSKRTNMFCSPQGDNGGSSNAARSAGGSQLRGVGGSQLRSVGARANSEATGAPGISGVPRVGDTLTATTAGIADADGMGRATLIYQWRADNVDIASATGQTYTVSGRYVGQSLTVRVSFTDDAGNREWVTSAPTASVFDTGLRLEEATVNGSTLQLRFDELLNTQVDLPETAFTVTVNDVAVTVSDSSAWSTILTLTLASAVAAGDTVTVSYTKPEGSNGIVDLRVRVADSFSGQAVSNETGEEQENSPATGTPTISGTARVGETLTASTSGIADADGLTNVAFTYQWLADDVEISGATGSTYELTTAEAGKTVMVRVSFTDDAGNSESLTSGATESVASTNSSATGTPAISGTARVGETLTASTSGIADADGLTNVSYSYEWLADDSVISGATGSTYTLVAGDQGKAVTVRVSFTDDAGNAETVTSAATATVARPLLTASVSDTPESHDGSAAFTFELRFSEEFGLSYVTLRDHAFTVTGGEVTGVSRLAQGSNVGWRITVEPSGNDAVTLILPVTTDCEAEGAICTDDGRMLSGRVEVAVAGPSGQQSDQQETQENSSATGRPTISGTARVGETLTVSTSGIADADGLTNVSYSYRWLADGSGISGVTGSTYELTTAEVGRNVKVRVSFTDDAGNRESLTSAATGTVAALLTASASKIPESHDGSASFTFWLHFSEGINASYVTLRDHAFTVTGGEVTRAKRMVPGYSQGWLITVEPSGNDAVTLVLPVTTDCAAEGAICTDDGRMLSGRVEVSVPGPSGQQRDQQETQENSPATGAPTISGTARVGETLTASTTGIADADGLTNATFTYQWLADDADISGATGSTYELASGDAGKTIKVRVSFTDDAGNAESLTSGATATVAAANSPATGSPTISGTARVGETLTASTSGIADADGLTNATFNYEWLADDSVISGATGSTYRLVAGDQGKAVKVRVSFTDDAGNAESLTGAATQAVAAANNPATGTPTISGTARVGETLTASTSAIADSDGLTNVSYSYEWLAGGSVISGATGSTYELTTAEAGNNVRVRVSFNDDAGNAESLTSGATATVAPPLPPLTASVQEVPASHDGSASFTFELRFSEEFGISYVTLRDHAFTVTGGEVTRAKRAVPGYSQGWLITVEPSGNDAVTLILPITTDCAATGAICTDDGRMLSNETTVTVAGP